MTLAPSLLLSVRRMIDDVIRREGGYVNHPADRGGPTKYGITQATYDSWRDLNHWERRSVRALNKMEAHAIYEDEYFLKPGIGKLPLSIQPFVFDAAVNHGPVQAIKFVQKVCAREEFDIGPIDGIIGPRTIAAAREFERWFLTSLIYERDSFYRDIVDRDPSQQVFLAGWLNRLDEFKA